VSRFVLDNTVTMAWCFAEEASESRWRRVSIGIAAIAAEMPRYYSDLSEAISMENRYFTSDFKSRS
jgi:hypothetical protein